MISIRLILNFMNLSEDFNDTMFSYGFIPLITRPTRVTQSSATLIENIFTNQLVDPHNESMQGILITDISDHYPIFHMTKSIKKREAEVKISRRNYNMKNKDKFVQLMSAVDWSAIFAAVDSQNFLCSIISWLKFMTCVFPLRVYQKSIIPENTGYHKVFGIPLKRKRNCISKVRNIIVCLMKVL